MSAAEISSATAEPSRAEKQRWMREESRIVKKFHGRVPWEMVAWGLGNFVLWLALWPLVIAGLLPLWAGFLAATVSISICYLPSHEAQHSIIAGQGTKLRWLNELVGHVALLPLVLPYRIARLTHHQHHAHANDPERDPDHYNQADTWWRSVWRGILSRQHGAENPYSNFIGDPADPEVKRALLEALLVRTGHYAVISAFAWSGFALEAALLWWLPRHIATSYIQLVLSWAPHHPMVERGRYRDTRAWRSPVGTLLSVGMEYHLVHHLFPKIPLTQTPAAWRELRELLETRGIRNDGLS